jgi:hypothetical protein
MARLSHPPRLDNDVLTTLIILYRILGSVSVLNRKWLWPTRTQEGTGSHLGQPVAGSEHDARMLTGRCNMLWPNAVIAGHCQQNMQSNRNVEPVPALTLNLLVWTQGTHTCTDNRNNCGPKTEISTSWKRSYNHWTATFGPIIVTPPPKSSFCWETDKKLNLKNYKYNNYTGNLVGRSFGSKRLWN